MAKNPQIEKLNQLGQSIWYDNLSRDVLNSGELKSLIDTGVSGLTSNPTIFKNAIADSSLYDTELKALAQKGLNTEEICEELMIEDVKRAADLLRPIFDSSNATDGHASIEVSPYLARDGKTTVEAAKRIFKKLDRPNIMIKIPGTPECLGAIEETLSAGINVNVTLLFNEENYVKVAEAYIRACEKRVSEGKDCSRLASVASFFVSRVDALCEKNLDALVQAGKLSQDERNNLSGKIGVANSKCAYLAYEKLFKGARFAPLASKGAQVQRPLWASTGTKNPAFKAVMYVEALAGKETVNTVPPATLKALLEGANIEPLLHLGTAEAPQLLTKIKSYGLDFDKLMLDLQNDGVKLFSDSYRDLLASIDKKRTALGV
jgi:transaldolase